MNHLGWVLSAYQCWKYSTRLEFLCRRGTWIPSVMGSRPLSSWYNMGYWMRASLIFPSATLSQFSSFSRLIISQLLSLSRATLGISTAGLRLQNSHPSISHPRLVCHRQQRGTHSSSAWPFTVTASWNPPSSNAPQLLVSWASHDCETLRGLTFPVLRSVFDMVPWCLFLFAESIQLLFHSLQISFESRTTLFAL